MKKILVYFSDVEHCIFLLNIFNKHINKKNKKIKPIRAAGAHFDSWFNNSLFDVEFFEKKFNFIYKNNLIDINLKQFYDLNDYDSKSLDSKLKLNLEVYDKVIFIQSFTFTHLYSLSKIPKKYNTVFLVQHEMIELENEDIEGLINKNKKIISNTNLYINDRKIYYDINLTLAYFYFYLGFYHLNFNIEVNKKNLVGFYHKFNHKNNRDRVIKLIIGKLNNNKLPYKNYSKNNLSDNVAQVFDLLYNRGFMKSHISSYTDYVNSVVGIVSESNESVEDNKRHHVTEKTLKAILFSKLNIIFILYANYNLLLELKNKGYWFLNLEFLDDHTKSNTTQESLVINSIQRSIDYIADIYEKNDNNLEKTKNYLISKHKDKMQKNYKILMDTIYNYKNSDDFLDFLLDE